MNFQEILNKFQNLRPLPERKFDQFYATAETVLKRKELIISLAKRNNINSILFLGDDDLTSIALALENYFEKIFVIDIDERILSFIELIAEKENLKIKTFNYDLKNPLIQELKEKFDLIFFDPPYTPQAVKLWLIRALEISLGKGENKKRKNPEFLKNKFYLMCYGYTDKSLEKGYQVQEVINKFGLLIQEKLRKFNQYTGAQRINNESDLYILQPTPAVDLKIIDSYRKKRFKEKIYTFE